MFMYSMSAGESLLVITPNLKMRMRKHKPPSRLEQLCLALLPQSNGLVLALVTAYVTADINGNMILDMSNDGLASDLAFFQFGLLYLYFGNYQLF